MEERDVNINTIFFNYIKGKTNMEMENKCKCYNTLFKLQWK